MGKPYISISGTFRSVLATVAIACGCLAYHLPAYAEAGSSGYDFLNISSSSHSYALGGSAIALIDDDVALVHENPALIGPELDNQVNFGYMHYMGGGNFAGLTFGRGAGERGAWAAGIRYLDYGSFDGYDHMGSETGKFRPTDIVFGGAYSHDISSRWRGGVSLNMIYSHYDVYSAFALSVDLGVSYYDEDHDLSFAFVVKNAGGQLKRFHQAYTRLPIDVQIGYMQGIGHSPFSIAITAKNLTRWNLPSYTHSTSSEGGLVELKSNFFQNFFRHLTFGVQYAPSEKFYLALAYDYKTRSDMSAFSRNFLSGFSLGAGIRVKAFGVGVAYGMPHASGSQLMLNLSCSIGELVH